MRRRKPRLNDDPERHAERLRLFEYYATGEGPLVGEGLLPGHSPPIEQMDAEAWAAQRLPRPGQAVWPPELVRLREALARARDESA
jgi:hypothetical protein